MIQEEYIMKKNEIVQVITNIITDVTKIETDMIDVDNDFLSMGLNSIQAIKVVNLLQQKLNVELDFADIFEYQTINDLSEYLSAE